MSARPSLARRCSALAPYGCRARRCLRAQSLQVMRRQCSPAASAPRTWCCTDLIARHALPIAIFTLDTGRLPERDLRADRPRARTLRPRRSRSTIPMRGALERFVRENGVNAFYHSVELRKRCCAIRKVEPLARALAGKRAWITGLRREQSATRGARGRRVRRRRTACRSSIRSPTGPRPTSGTTSAPTTCPTTRCTTAAIRSIGCAPCTRAVDAGEDIRAGRWWWEQP